MLLLQSGIMIGLGAILRVHQTPLNAPTGRRFHSHGTISPNLFFGWLTGRVAATNCTGLGMSKLFSFWMRQARERKHMDETGKREEAHG